MTPAAPAPPPDPTPTPAAPPKPLKWPEWFVAFDTALAVLAVVLAFLMASFVARNADVWRHLAAGRLVAQGQYPFGGDPFSYTAPNGVWVNPNWLSETFLYLLHSADASGGVAVAVKAVLFAAAVGLLFLLKKPGQSIWPWAVAAAVGAVAAGAHTHLRPPVFGFPLFAGLLVLIFRGNWTTGNKWRMPAVVGGLTALWANVDAFALLAPLFVGLTLVGEWLHPKVFTNRADLPPDADPFRAPPPKDALVRALLLSVVGLLLNPTFLAALPKDPSEAVAQLVPFELDWQTAADLEPDTDFSRYTRSALHGKYVSDKLYGLNPAGILALVVFGLGAVAAGVNYRGGRLSHLLGWAGLVLLAVAVHARFVPYAVLVGVPFLAAHLNGLGRLVPPLETASDRVGHGLLSLARLGRVLTLLGVLLLMAAAVPGWLHPQSGIPSMTRCVAWKVEADEGMERAGKLFAAWRADPEKAAVLGEARMLNVHTDVGDYLAWYAPAERSFVTSRFRLHHGQWADLVAARGVISPAAKKNEEDADPLAKLSTLIDERYPSQHIGYVVLGQGFRTLNMDVLRSTARGLDDLQAGRQRIPPLGDTLWHADGRVAVVGRADTADGQRRCERMRWDPVALAFGPAAAIPPTDPAKNPFSRGIPPQEGWMYEILLVRPPVPATGLDDARWFQRYTELLEGERRDRSAIRLGGFQFGLLATGGGVGVCLALPLAPPDPKAKPGDPEPQPRFHGPLPAEEPPVDAVFALPLLTARAARAAAARTPDGFDGYQLLADALDHPLMPDTDPPREVFPVYATAGPTDRQLQVITALSRASARLPAAGGEVDRFTPIALRVRAYLLLQYLRVGELGYVGPAEVVARELKAMAKAPPGDLARANLPLLDIWERVFELCKMELDLELQLYTSTRGSIPFAWEQMYRGGKVFELMVERGYLQADDDPRKWRPKYEEAMAKNAKALREGGQVEVGEVQTRLDRLLDVLGLLVARRSDRARPTGSPPEVQFYNLIAAGLPNKAVDMIPGEKETDKPKVNVDAPEVLRAMIWAGQAEQAAYELKEQKARTLDRAGDLPAAVATVLTAKYRVVEFDLAKLAGDYAAAGQLYEELLATPAGGLPQSRGGPDELLFGDVWRPAVFRTLSDADAKRVPGGGKVVDGSAALAGFVGLNISVQVTERLRACLLFEAYTRYQRGVFALHTGDTVRAKEHFEAALAPRGIPLGTVGVPQALLPTLGRLLPKYRDLLAKYAK